MRTSGRDASVNIDDRRQQGRLARRNVGMIGRAPWADPRRQLSDYLLSPETLGGGSGYSAYGVDAAIAATPNYKLQRDRIAREQMDYLVSSYDSTVFAPSTATVNLVADAADTPAFARHLQQASDSGAVSSNIEDRRSYANPVARSFEFDGTTVWLDVSRPDGSIMSDEEAVKAYEESGSNLGTSWQPYWQSASKSPTYNFSSQVSHNLTDGEIATLTRTVLGEAGGEGVAGMTAVANVINNRSLSNGLYPANPADVALQPYQFSTWNSADRGGNQAMVLANYPPDSQMYQLAEAIVRRTFIDGTMPDNTGGAYNYHVTGITNAWIQDLQANSPYGAVQIGNQTFYPQHPIPPMNIPDVASLLDTAGGSWAPPLPQPRPEPGTINPAIARALEAMGGVNSDVAVSPYVSWSGQIVSRETIPLTSAEIDDQLYSMIAPQTPALDPIGAGPGTWGDFTKAMGVPLPAPAPLKPGEPSAPPPLPRPRPDNVTSEGLAIRKVRTVAIGPDGNPVVNAPRPVPVSGKPVSDDRAEAIKDYQANLPATVKIRQIGGTIPTTGSPVGTVALPGEPPGLNQIRKTLQQGVDAQNESLGLSGHPTPAQKKAINDVSQVGSPKPTVDQIKAIRDVSAVVVPSPSSSVNKSGALANVGKEPPAVTMGTKTTQVTEWIENPAYAKWLETYGHGGANVSGSPDDRDEANALAKSLAGPSTVPPPPPATIPVTRDKTTTVRTVAEPKAPAVPTYINSRGQQVVKVQTTRYDPDLNDWVPVEKYVPVEKAATGALPAGSAVVQKPKSNNGGGGGGAQQSSGSSPQYVRQKDGSALKQVTGTVFNYDTQQFETRTHYVSA